MEKNKTEKGKESREEIKPFMSENSLLHAPSLSPQILSKFAMNPTKSDEDSGEPFFHRHYHHYHNHHRQILDEEDEPHRHFQSSVLPGPPFSIFRDTDDDDNDNSSPGPSDDDPDDVVAPASPPTLPDAVQNSQTLNSSIAADSSGSASIQSSRTGFVNPEPHISSQFYTFNKDSHSLMIKCLVEGRLATPAEIRVATSPEVLRSWRAVWKDRNEDTAYTTAWKRIQDKLQAHVDEHGNRFLCFKNSSSQQFVSHFDQWQDIVMSFHGDSDLKHLGLRETIERIKQVWTVGAKFYGIPESFIRVCVSSCSVCSGVGAGDGGTGGFGGGRPKRRRFEYTESFDVPAKEVPNKLQQLAKKHKVVLCIRQKYIRYKPFMAEVKDYACHRAGEPASKKSSKALKREPYASKRCGCGFRIRAIVPIANYNEKDKTFVYQDEGMAVFKLYAVHTGHEPGPLDGNARIMHRVVGQKGGFLMEQEAEYGVNEVVESDDVLSGLGVDEGDFRLTVMHQLQELKNEVGLLEGKIGKAPHELLGSVSRDLYDIVNKVRLLGDEATKPSGLLSNNKPHSDVLLRNGDLNHWSDAHTEGMYVDGKDTDLIDDDDDSFGRTLSEVAPWDEVGDGCRSEKDMISEACKAEKWLNSSEFDEKSILHSQGSKLTKSISLTRHDDDDSIDTDVGLVGIQVDSFYPENPKWYDSPCGLDSGTDCGESGFRHGEIV